MPRSEARFQFGIWEDGLDGYGAHAKLLYAVILTDPFVTWAGNGPLRLPTWARAGSLDESEIRKALDELTAGDPFEAPLSLDERTDEVLVRTMIRNDGVADQPNVLKGALGSAVLMRSPALRRILAAELWKLPPQRPDKVLANGRTMRYPDPHATARVLDPYSGPPGDTSPGTLPAEPFPGNPSAGTLAEPFRNPSAGTLEAEPRGVGVGVGEVLAVPENSSHKEPFFVQDRFATSDTATVHRLPETSIEDEPAGSDDHEQGRLDEQRPDVEAVCARMAARVGDNTGKRPKITETWRRDARLLLDSDLDHEPPGDRLPLVLAVIDWTANDPFWSTNVLGLPKLRKQFTTLRLKRREEHERSRRPVSTGRPGRENADVKIARLLINDPEDEVRNAARARLAEAGIPVPAAATVTPIRPPGPALSGPTGPRRLEGPA